MSTAALRTVCNHYGISVRDNTGKYINMAAMKKALAENGLDGTIFNKKSKISARLAIDYNDWRTEVNKMLQDNPINSIITIWIGKPNRDVVMTNKSNKLRRVGMDTVAELTFLVTRLEFDTELRLHGSVIGFIDNGIDPHIEKHFIQQTMLDFSYVHKQRYGVVFNAKKSKRTFITINKVIGNVLDATMVASFAALNPSANITDQPEPLWFYPKAHVRPECFKDVCTQSLKGESRSGEALGMAKIHVSFNQKYQTFTLYNYLVYLTQYPHLFRMNKMFLMSFDSRFHVDDSDVEPAKQQDWVHYLNMFGYGARAQIVIYLSHPQTKLVNNTQMQVELDTFIDYWTSSGVDALIGRKSNNLVYNERLTSSIFYSIASSTDRQEAIRDSASPNSSQYAISKPLEKERNMFCAKDALRSTDSHCIQDKWGITPADLCGEPEDGKYPRSDMYFYHQGIYSPDYFYHSETCADRRRRRDRAPELPDNIYERHYPK